jgi:glycosyltransferase involved in cell wall biosynthesis
VSAASRRRIPVVLASSGHVWGGTERIVDALARGLDPNRFPAWMVLSPAPGVDAWADDLRRLGLPVERIPEITNRLQLARAGRWLGFLKRHRDALLHVHHTYLAADRYLVPLAHLAGMRAIVVTEHLGVGRAHSRGQRFLKRWERSRTDVTVAVSVEVAHALSAEFEIPAELIEIVPNGVRVPGPVAGARERMRETWGVGPSERVWLCVARLEPEKGIDVLLAAWKLLPEPRPRLVIVGEGSRRAELENTASDLGLGGGVRFAGASRDARTLYQAADGFVLCSRKEGMPVTLLEAMAAGLPCVVTDVGGVPLASDRGQAARVVPAEDARAFADQVAALEHDRDAARALGARAARRVAERFSEERMVDGYEAIYERALRLAHPVGAPSSTSVAA